MSRPGRIFSLRHALKAVYPMKLESYTRKMRQKDLLQERAEEGLSGNAGSARLADTLAHLDAMGAALAAARRVCCGRLLSRGRGRCAHRRAPGAAGAGAAAAVAGACTQHQLHTLESSYGQVRCVHCCMP